MVACVSGETPFQWHPREGRAESNAERQREPRFKTPESFLDRRLLIFLLDRASLTRECLSRLFEQEGSGVRVRSAADLSDLVCEAGSSADAVVLDIKASPVSDPDVQAQFAAIIERMPNTPILIISERGLSADALQAVRSGASGYFPVALTARMLIAATRLVAAGGIFLPPSTLQNVAATVPEGCPENPGTAMQ